MDILAFYDSISTDTVDEWIAYRQEENLNLEFKTVNDVKLDRDDRKNLAKAMSGFANSSGGVIVWGVEANKNKDHVDCANSRQEIVGLSQFVSRLNELTGQATSPGIEGIRHRRIEAGPDRGFGVTLVPESDSGPYMAKLGENRYYKRSGDSFYIMEHFDIADMFGKRKQPKLELCLTSSSRFKLVQGEERCEFSVLLALKNTGRGTAKAPFLDIDLPADWLESDFGVDGNTHLPLPRLYQSDSKRIQFGANANFVVHPGMSYDITKLIRLTHVGAAVAELVLTYRIASEDVNLQEAKVSLRVT